MAHSLRMRTTRIPWNTKRRRKLTPLFFFHTHLAHSKVFSCVLHAKWSVFLAPSANKRRGLPVPLEDRRAGTSSADCRGESTTPMLRHFPRGLSSAPPRRRRAGEGGGEGAIGGKETTKGNRSPAIAVPRVTSAPFQRIV